MVDTQVEETREERVARQEKERREDFIAGLRAMADAFESRPTMPIPRYGITIEIDATVSEYKLNTETNEYQTYYDTEATLKKLKGLLRTIPGKKDKKFLDWCFRIHKDFGGGVEYNVQAQRQAVCKKVPTGETVIHAARTEFIPERKEEKFEWVCEDAVILSSK